MTWWKIRSFTFIYYLLIVVYEDDWKSFLGLIHFGRFDAWDFVALVPRWPYPFKASSVACPWFPAVANLWSQLMQGSDWAWGSGSDTEAKREMCATGHATFGRFVFEFALVYQMLYTVLPHCFVYHTLPNIFQVLLSNILFTFALGKKNI